MEITFNGEEVENLKEFVFGAIRKSDKLWDLIPKKMLLNKDFVVELCHSETEAIDYNGRIFDKDQLILKTLEICPKEFLDDVSFALDLFSVSYIGCENIKFFSDRVRDNEEVIISASNNTPGSEPIINFASNRLKNDKEFILRLLREHEEWNYEMSWIPEHFINDKDVLLEAAGLFMGFEDIPEAYKDDEELLLKISEIRIPKIETVSEKTWNNKKLIHKMLRTYAERDIPKTSTVYHRADLLDFQDLELKKVFDDYLKMGRYETVVKVILKKGLPLEISRPICEFL